MQDENEGCEMQHAADCLQMRLRALGHTDPTYKERSIDTYGAPDLAPLREELDLAPLRALVEAGNRMRSWHMRLDHASSLNATLDKWDTALAAAEELLRRLGV